MIVVHILELVEQFLKLSVVAVRRGSYWDTDRRPQVTTVGVRMQVEHLNLSVESYAINSMFPFISS